MSNKERETRSNLERLLDGIITDPFMMDEAIHKLCQHVTIKKNSYETTVKSIEKAKEHTLMLQSIKSFLADCVSRTNDNKSFMNVCDMYREYEAYRISNLDGDLSGFVPVSQETFVEKITLILGPQTRQKFGGGWDGYSLSITNASNELLFFDEHLENSVDTDFILINDIYDNYRMWVRSEHSNARPSNCKRLAEYMINQFGEPKLMRDSFGEVLLGKRAWYGYKLRPYL